jgi:site-specific recombinase
MPYELIESLPADAKARVEAMRGFVDRIRPRARLSATGLTPLLARIRVHEGDRRIFANAIAALILDTRHTALFAEVGILPARGFVAELYRRISHRLLPQVPDVDNLRDALAELFHHRHDDTWLENVPLNDWLELTTLVTPLLPPAAVERMRVEVSEALAVLSIRLAGLGLDAELTRVVPALAEHDSPFVAQQRALTHWLEAPPDQHDACTAAARHVLVLQDQSRDILTRARRNTASTGTSFSLTYHIRRLEQMIERMESLLLILIAQPDHAQQHRAGLLAELLLATARRNDVRLHVTQSMDLVARRVTEHAGRTGEHYITASRQEYFGMFRAALGAGAIVAFMAWAKVAILGLHLPALIEVFAICGMYAAAFILIHMLHFSLATKQPAMTAAAIAGVLEESRESRTNDRVERLAELVARVSRSQFAAVMGNLLLTLPVAILLTYLCAALGSGHIAAPEKALSMLGDADIRSMAFFYAATAGVVLFAGGLISGYFDNKASYSHVRQRIAAHRFLNRILGSRATAQLADYLENNLGALVGNAALGFMLGMVGPLGEALGLPLDVRHVTITAASVGLALPSLSFDVGVGTFVAVFLGIGLIGLFNLLVSFGLTLWLAFKARKLSLPERHLVLPVLAARFRRDPRSFFLPPRE